MQEANNDPDPDLHIEIDFEEVSFALNYSEHLIPLPNIVNALKSENERIVAFSVCELIACTNDNIPEKVISYLVDIAEAWGWKPSDIEIKIRSLRLTTPRFFKRFLSKLF